MRLYSFLAICFALYSQDLPDVAALMEQSADGWKKHKSYQMSQEMTIETTMAGNPVKMVTTSDVFAINPDKMRIEGKSSMGGATIVSTAAARRAGITDARNAANKSVAATIANVIGLADSTPKTAPSSNRPMRTAPTPPSAVPASAVSIPSRIT